MDYMACPHDLAECMLSAIAWAEKIRPYKCAVHGIVGVDLFYPLEPASSRRRRRDAA